ncbi:hypothetical protein [Ochrobactrum sp. BTU1]|uniref:hypothetical protein n=1 Tax=Ochrobactrum sp. BTU1 TaxID=2840456 RepID=UPI001C05E0B8|nr:hypothetical protein KMS41_14140 [Ochrobactrum sp. BTU1]
MSFTRRICIRWLARITLKRPIKGGRIYLSPPESLKNNCYSLKLIEPDNSSEYVIEGRKQQALEGLRFDEERFDRGGIQDQIQNSQLARFKVYFVHYYKGFRFKYDHAFKALFHHYTRFYLFYVVIDNLKQRKYNKMKLANIDRYKVLQMILNNNIDDIRSYQNSFTLIEQIYTSRWVHHPDNKKLMNYYSLVFDSLHKSGDLEKDGMQNYRITGQGLSTLSKYETDFRRHRDNVIQQIILAVLTFALVLIGAGDLIVNLTK